MFKQILAGLLLITCVHAVQASTVYTTQPSFESAVGSVVIADFDTLGSGTSVDAQFAPIGMDFNSFASGSPTVQPFNNVSSPNIMVANPLGIIGGGAGGFEVELTNPAFGIGMYFGGLQPIAQFGSTILELLDTSGNAIDSFIVQDEVGVSAFGLLFFGVTSSTLIKSFNVTIGDSDFVWFDDVQYGLAPNPIPVPAAVWLFGSALIGLVGFSKRRKTA